MAFMLAINPNQSLNQLHTNLVHFQFLDYDGQDREYLVGGETFTRPIPPLRGCSGKGIESGLLFSILSRTVFFGYIQANIHIALVDMMI